MGSQRVPIERFPPEVLYLVFKDLKLVELSLCTMVRRQWRCLLNSLENKNRAQELINYAVKCDNAKIITQLMDPNCVNVPEDLEWVATVGAAGCMEALKRIGVTASYADLNSALEEVEKVKGVGKEKCVYLILEWMKEVEDREDEDTKKCDQKSCVPKIEEKLRLKDLTRDELILKVEELEAKMCSICRDTNLDYCNDCEDKFCCSCINSHNYQIRKAITPTILDIVNTVVATLKKGSILIKDTNRVRGVIREVIDDKGWVEISMNDLGMKFGDDFPCDEGNCRYEDTPYRRRDYEPYSRCGFDCVIRFEIRGLEIEGDELVLQYCSFCFDNNNYYIYEDVEKKVVAIIYERVVNHLRLEQLPSLSNAL